MKAGGWIIILILIAAVVGIGLLYRHFETESPPEAPSPIAAELIATAQPVTRTLSQRVPWIGVVASQSLVQLRAQQTGRVETIDAQDESPVAQGTTILQLGGPLVELQRARLKADMESLTLQADLAGQNLSRLKENHGVKLAPAEQVSTAQEAQIKIVTELRDTQLVLETLEQQLRIVAPVTGVFTNRRVSLGQTVSVGDMLGEIIDPNHLRIVASLFAPHAVALEGVEATVRVDATRSLAGTVRRVLAQAGNTGATVVWIEGPQIDQQVRPGQTVSGEATIAVKLATLTVPQSAIVYDANEQPHVFVEKGGTYESRPVRLGLTQDGWVEVLSGLQQGRPVVTQGAYELFYRQFNEHFKVED